MSEAGIIRKQLRLLENKVNILSELREVAKRESGRLDDFGTDLLALAKQHGVKQSLMAKVLDISASAVSQHYAK